MKLATGYTCDRCGDAPFSGAREKVAPPAPVVVRAAMPEVVMTTDFVSSTTPDPGPRPVLCSSREPPAGTTHVLWTEAGAGVRFALEAPLQVLPPGEPVQVRVLIENRGPYVVMVSLLLVQSPKSPGQQPSRVTTGDLPVGSILDASYMVDVPGPTSQCRLSALGQALKPSGVAQDRWRAPELVADMGPPTLGLPSSQATISFRTKARCPRCDGPMRWAPAQPPKARGWVCQDCAHRVETGSLT